MQIKLYMCIKCWCYGVCAFYHLLENFLYMDNSIGFYKGVSFTSLGLSAYICDFLMTATG
jgi:hypothetical protein